MSFNYIEFLQNVFIGLITGATSSFLCWWLITRKYVPKVTFDQQIMKMNSKKNKSKYAYKFRIHNSLKKNSLFDISVHEYLYLPDYKRKGHSFIYRIPIDTPTIVLMEPEIGKEKKSRIITFKLSDKDFYSEIKDDAMPENILKKLKNHTVTLEDLLEIVDGAFIRVFVMACHGFTLSKRVFRHDYKIENLIMSD